MADTQSDARTKFHGLTSAVCGLLAVGAALASVLPPNLSQPVDPVSLTMAIVFTVMAIAFAFLIPSAGGGPDAR